MNERPINVIFFKVMQLQNNKIRDELRELVEKTLLAIPV